MNNGVKEAIIFKKTDRFGSDKEFTIYMIDETLAREFKSLVKRKEEYQNTWLVKKILPKDLYEQVEARSSLNENQIEKYKAEKELQFNIKKYDLEPYSLRKHMNNLKVI